MLDLRAPQNALPFTVLTYGWEYYSQELLSPGEFSDEFSDELDGEFLSGHVGEFSGNPRSESNNQVPSYIYLGQYGGFESGNPDGFPHGCATYRLNIKLPAGLKQYALELPEIYTVSRVWVNGQPVSSLGDVTGSDRSPAIRTGMVTFHAEGNAELVVQASDYSHYYSGMVYPPAFGTPEAVSDLLSLRLLRTCMMVISSCTIGLLYLLIGLKIGSGQKQMTLFALISILFALHTAYPLFHLFGAGIWSYRLEDLSFHLFLFLIAVLHCSLCGVQGRQKKAVLFVGGTAALLSFTVPVLFPGGNLSAMMVYSAFIDGYKLLLFGWLITTALFNRKEGGATDGPLLAGLCVIAVSLLAQTMAPIFEPVRFGWQTENAGFVFILLLAGGLWFDTVSAYAGRTALAENIRLMKNQIALQEENYQIITGDFEEIRQMRHDLRHHLLTIRELVNGHQYEELGNYISGYDDTARQAARPLLCENQAANAVLNYYLRAAEKRKIPLDIKVSLPPTLKLESWNLGILFGNLLENALDASEHLPAEKRMVLVYAKIERGNLLLTVKNHWNGDFSPSGGQILSTKHAGPGIGLASVKSLVEKNNGQFYLVPGKKAFEVSVVLWGQV